jgi:hypothetical protein
VAALAAHAVTYDRAALYKIVLEEGQEADQRRLLNWRLLRSLVPADRPTTVGVAKGWM